MEEKPQNTTKHESTTSQNSQPIVTPTQQPPVTTATNGFAVASLVLGIIGVIFCWIPFAAFGGQIVPILGFIFGLLGMNKKYQTGRGMAIAGLVMSIIAFVIETIWVILMIIGAIADSAS